MIWLTWCVPLSLLTPVQSARCFFSLSCLLKVQPQVEQAKGLVPAWMRRCSSRWLFLLNILLHSRHTWSSTLLLEVFDDKLRDPGVIFAGVGGEDLLGLISSSLLVNIEPLDALKSENLLGVLTVLLDLTDPSSELISEMADSIRDVWWGRLKLMMLESRMAPDLATYSFRSVWLRIILLSGLTRNTFQWPWLLLTAFLDHPPVRSSCRTERRWNVWLTPSLWRMLSLMVNSSSDCIDELTSDLAVVDDDDESIITQETVSVLNTPNIGLATTHNKILIRKIFDSFPYPTHSRMLPCLRPSGGEISQFSGTNFDLIFSSKTQEERMSWSQQLSQLDSELGWMKHFFEHCCWSGLTEDPSLSWFWMNAEQWLQRNVLNDLFFLTSLQ